MATYTGNSNDNTIDRLKLAVLARVQIAYYERGSVKAAADELPMLTPLRELDL